MLSIQVFTLTHRSQPKLILKMLERQTTASTLFTSDENKCIYSPLAKKVQSMKNVFLHFYLVLCLKKSGKAASLFIYTFLPVG